MAAARKKKTRIKSPNDMDIFKAFGRRPEFLKDPDDDPTYNTEFGRALNWVNASVDIKQGKKELLVWMKVQKYGKKDTDAIRAVPDCYLASPGKLASLANNNFALSLVTISNMKSNLEGLIKRGKFLAKELKKNTKEKDKIDQLRKDNSVSTESKNMQDACMLADIIEDSVFGDEVLDQDAIKIEASSVKGPAIAQAIEKVRGIRDEILLAKTDKEIAEAYEDISVRRANKIIKLLEQGIVILEGTKLNKTVTRKQRVAKPKSAAQQIARLKYKKTDNTYNVTSVDPMTIIEAQKVIIFNTKTRKLGIYYAKDGTGLKVKGTTIIDYDENLSLQKTLRETKSNKIVDNVNAFRKAPKIRADKMFADIKTTDIKLNGRFNTEILILKVFR